MKLKFGVDVDYFFDNITQNVPESGTFGVFTVIFDYPWSEFGDL